MAIAEEKRRAPRVKVNSTALVKLSAAHENAPDTRASTRDISTRGVFLYLDHKLLEGSNFELVLMLPEEVMATGRAWVCCQGTVVRVESEDRQDEEGRPVYGIAAEFKKCTVLPEI